MSVWLRNLLIACCLLASSSATAHLLAPEQMFIRMDNANQAFMLYLTPPVAALASFDRDSDGALSAEEINAQREPIDQFLDQSLVFSFAGQKLRRVFSDITSNASLDHDHSQVTIIRRYVAEQALPGLIIEYGLVPAVADDQQAAGLRAVVRSVDADNAEIFTIAVGGAASTHEIIWDPDNYYRASPTWRFVLAAAAVGIVIASFLWLLRMRGRRSKPEPSIASDNNSSAGFSLIEVMVALVVAAISLSALSLALSRQANQQIIMRESVWGQVVAMNALVEMGAGTGEVFASKGGSEMLLDQEWDWEASAGESSEVSIDVVEVQALLEDNTVATMTGYLFFPERLE